MVTADPGAFSSGGTALRPSVMCSRPVQFIVTLSDATLVASDLLCGVAPYFLALCCVAFSRAVLHYFSRAVLHVAPGLLHDSRRERNP